MTGGDGQSPNTQKAFRVLVVHRYYWPDTPPYASMLRRIVGRWHQDGHSVEVISAQPSYKAGVANEKRPWRDEVDGVRVHRLALPNEQGRPIRRILNAIRLSAAMLHRALLRRYDVIMISTSPPVLGGVAAALAAKLTKARFIYHCMDIHPEVGRVSGEFSNPWVFGALRKLDNWACHQADPVVVLSRDMEKTLKERPGGENLRIRILNNFSLPDEGGVSPPPFMETSGIRLRVIFAGNIGRFQGLETVVEAMERLKERKDTEFVLMGDGVAKKQLEDRAHQAGANLRFLGHQSVEVAKAAMRQADAGFVSLVPGLFRYAYPSKTMTYLEQGCPLIAAVEPDSELAEDVVRQGYGHVVPVGDSEALAALLVRLADDQSGWKNDMRESALRAARDTFSEPVVLDQWSALLANRTERT